MAREREPGEELGNRVAVRIRVEVEIASGSVWSADSTMEQIRRQGIEGALNKLENAAREHGFRIVGKPTFTALLAEGN